MTVYQEYLCRLSQLNNTDYQDEGTQNHLKAVALPLDDLVDKARAVMLARLIQYAPEDALMLLGAERRIKRYPSEPLETYRKRVLGAWDYWRMAGTVPGVKLALEQAGYSATIIEHGVGPDRDERRWAEFSVTVGPIEALKTAAHWGTQDASWDGKQYWGFKLPAVPLSYLVDLVREVKPAHSRLRRLIWSPRGRYWGGSVGWGDGRDDPNAQPKQTFWGLTTGIQGYVPPPERTDSGAAWGESDIEIIYEYEGAPDA